MSICKGGVRVKHGVGICGQPWAAVGRRGQLWAAVGSYGQQCCSVLEACELA